MLQTTEVLKLAPGKGARLNTVTKWLSRPEGGDNFLNVLEVGPWTPQQADDMVTLQPDDQTDKFGQRLGDTFAKPYHALVGSHQHPSKDDRFGPVWPYNPAAFSFAGNVICMFLSFAIPTASIFALYYVHSMLARLIMVAVFILIFACAMMFAVGSRRGEVFAATAAFAAIQVVFVGGVNIIQQNS